MSEAPSVSKTEDRPVKLGLKANWRQSPHAGERIGWWHVWGGVFAVRPPDELAFAPLPGAVNIPLRELERRLAEDGLPEWRAAGLPILSGSIERKI
jgi:hypothetical protein